MRRLRRNCSGQWLVVSRDRYPWISRTTRRTLWYAHKRITRRNRSNRSVPRTFLCGRHGPDADPDRAAHLHRRRGRRRTACRRDARSARPDLRHYEFRAACHDDGVVFRLAREGQGWVLSPIYSFGSQKDDGVNPVSRVVFGPGGLLYGTTSSGGSGRGGTVFSLKPPATACKAALCPWVETILYNFTGGADGGDPLYGDLSFDQAGNIYGTTAGGGSSGEGVVFKLARSGSGWTESVLWNFTGGSDGGLPVSGVIFDSAGNLYGTTGKLPAGYGIRVVAHAIRMERDHPLFLHQSTPVPDRGSHHGRARRPLRNYGWS